MSTSDTDLLRALSVGPSYLLLGQRSAALKDAGDAPEPQTALAEDLSGLYNELAGLDDAGRTKGYQALSSATRNAAAPGWLQEVAKFPWNAVFTSRIDGAVAPAFRAEWRTVVPTVALQTSRRQRNPSELRVYHVFGSVVLDVDQQPPVDLLQRAARLKSARETLAELTSRLVTPRGVLLIEGYGADDWLEPEDLFAALSDLLPGQAHVFSATSEIEENVYLKAALDQGRLSAHSESLALFLSEAEASGRLMRPLASTSQEDRLLRRGSNVVQLPRQTWNAVIGSARPIDESLLETYPRASSPIEYERFHAFLGHSESAPPWRAISSGYSFVREFETELRTSVRKHFSATLIPRPIVLAGQTATGKSIALMALALEIARAGVAAVLHISKRGERPSLSALDNFALWAEENGFENTLVLWDGMTDTDDYFSIHRQLLARGRRVTIVGTTYISPGSSSADVVAPAELTANELAQFPLWLDSFGVRAELADQTDSSILAALYRILPSARRSLQRGLTLEVRHAESTIERRARSLAKETSWGPSMSTMADALIRAGLITEELHSAADPNSDLRDTGFLERSGSEQLTSIVLVAARYGLTVPLDLVLRILGREGSLALVEAVKSVDIIRWTDNDAGDQFLGARTALEAEILARTDLAGPAAETEVVAEMVRSVRQSPWGGGGPEVQFLVDLFDRIGPQSDGPDRHLPYMAPVLEAFEALHAGGRSVHHRLVLIECNLIRKYVQRAQRSGSLDRVERLDKLARAQSILEDTLSSETELGRSRLNLLVELASCLGARAYELSEADSPHELEVLVDRIVETTLDARSLDAENYYPVDVVAWVCERMLSKHAMTDERRVDLLASALASFETIERRDLTPRQRAKFDSRLARFGQLMNDPDMERANLERLQQNEDPAAYYLLAHARLGADHSDWDRETARAVLTMLRDAPDRVRSDWRCTGLLLDVFWWTKTGRRFMRGERQAVAFTSADWTECLDLTNRVLAAATYDQYRLDFLRGLAWFHLGSYKAAKQVFEVLDETTAVLSRRVIATYVASDEHGRNRVFDGQVRFVTPDGRRGRVWVDELGIELPFIPYRFTNETLRTGEPLSGFHIAFNLRGAYADPARTSGSRTGA